MKVPYPRTRVQGSLNPGKMSFTRLELPPPSSPTTSVFNCALMGTHMSMTDVVTPGFNVIKKTGGIVNTQMSRYREVTDYSTLTWNATKHPDANQPYAFATYVGNNGGLIDINLPGLSAKANLKSLTDPDKGKVLAGISARTRISPIHVQSLVSLVELPKTIDMIRDSVITLRNFRRAIVRGDSYDILRRIVGRDFKHGKTSRTVAQTSSSRWLQYRYGWLPLVYDVQGTIKALSKERELKTRSTARGKYTLSKKTSSQLTQVDLFGSLGDWTFTYTQEETLSCRAYCMYEADLRFQTARDFGLTELPLVAWELVPFSFVVDWFVDVGSWLEALTPKLGIKILAEGVTVKRTRSVQREVTAWLPGGTSGSYWQIPNCVGTSDSYFLEESSRTPNLTHIFSFPPIDVKLNVKRSIDAIALLRSVL